MNILITLTEAILLLSGAGSLEELGAEEYERYCALAEHPLCINLASSARLGSSGLFSSYQIASLQNYKEESGDILSISELGTVPGFTPEMATALSYFISLESHSPPGARRHRKIRQEAMVRSSGKDICGKYHAEAGERAELWLSAREKFSGALAIYGKRPWKLILGDFNARMGQGLLLWSSFSLSGFSTTDAFSKNASGLSGTGSWVPSWRGLASGYCGRSWQASLAAGIDGTLLGSASLLGNSGNLGANFIYGPRGKGASLDWKKSFGHLSCFGEAAFAASPAGVLGIRWDPAYKLSTVLLARYYPPEYQAPMAGAVRSGSKSRDEAGIAAGIRLSWFSATADMAFHPERWKQHSKNYQQFKSVVSAAPQFTSGRWSFSPSVRWTERMQLSPEGEAFRAAWRNDLRCDLKVSLSGLQGALRVNVLQTGELRPGGLAYLELGYATPSDTARLRLSLHIRGTICSTDGWESRIYAYERNLPGCFSVPAWYGRMQGLSAVAGVKYRRKRIRHQFDLRAGLVRYARETGKAPRAEIKFQYSLKL